MDLLSRLIAGSAATSPTKQKLTTAAERLSACKRICLTLQQIWRNGTRLSDDNASSSHVTGLLNRLNTILNEESRKAAPHSCLLYVTSTQIYIIVTKLALSSDSAEIIGAATHFFHHLINGEVEGVLDSKIFARALIDLVRRSTIFATIVVDEQGESQLLELLFEIATKIRLDPDILPGWFYPEREHGRKLTGAEARRSQFPLFYVLVDYVHHDGPMGDFARTGLLYLTETAARSKPLERWMIESDLAPQMASGVSALYSRLSRHAPTLHDNEKLPAIITLSDQRVKPGIVGEDVEESQQNIKAFLSYLAFWQDTLNHCKSPEVRETLLDHFQVLFVQQLLYPSLLESSDVAGGSTSAVILHLYRILDMVDHQQLLERMLQYLLASDRNGTTQSQSKHRRAKISISRRRSIEQLATLAELENTPSPDLFNLLDLLVISLHSKHAQTLNASLKLITIILRRHHPFVLHRLFVARSISLAENRHLLHDFNQTLMQFFDLAGTIAVGDADESYEAVLTDSRILLERHSCLLAKSDGQLIPDLADCLAIGPECRLFGALSDLTQSFFVNDPATNVALTETIVALATCEHVSMKLWLLHDTLRGEMQPIPFLDILIELTKQVQEWKINITDWDALFTYQKAQLVEEVIASDPKARSLSVQSRTSSIQHSPRMTAVDQQPPTPTKSASPRGRKVPAPAFASIDSTLGSASILGNSPAKKAVGSPLHQTQFPGETTKAQTTNGSPGPSASSLAILKQHVALPGRGSDLAARLPGLAERLKLKEAGSGSSTPTTHLDSGTATPSVQEEERSTATVSHVLTNAIILQEFILELAALLQIRGTFFDEVDLA